MKVNDLRLEIIETAIRKYMQGRDVNIYRASSTRAKVIEWGVNWCACGTQTAEATLEFASKLQKAAEIVKVLNGFEVECVYEADLVITSHEKFWQAVDTVCNWLDAWIETKNYDTIKAFLDHEMMKAFFAE